MTMLMIDRKAAKMLLVLAGFCFVITLSQIALAQVIPTKIENIATATTVLLGYENRNRTESFSIGSGVIIDKKKNNYVNSWNYSVLTAAHNLDRNSDGIIDSNDGIVDKYEVKLQTDKGQFKSYLVNKYQQIESEELGNLDLALLSFSSKSNYITALLLDNIETIKTQERIYVSGFPQSSIGLRIDEGILHKVTVPTKNDSGEKRFKFTGGYSLKYKPDDSNGMDYGMSGSPIFNQSGDLIGIHGRQDVLNRYKLGIGINLLSKDDLIEFQ